MAKRRRRGVMLLLLLALVLLLGLWGGGFLDGGGGGGRPQRKEAKSANRIHDVGSRRGDSDGKLSRNDVDAELAGMPGAAPSGSGAVAGGDGPGTGAGIGSPSGRDEGEATPKAPKDGGGPGPEPAPHVDRVRGLYRIVQDTATTRFFGEGFHALDQLALMPLDPEWEKTLAGARVTLKGRLDGHLADLAGRVDAGDAFGALRLLRPLLRAPHGVLASALAEQAAAKGWIPFDRALAAGADLPSPGRLEAQRAVDFWRDAAEPVRARVVQNRADGVVVLKVRKGSGITYPRVPRAQLAPVTARPEEMLDQALAAFAAGEEPLGLIWTAAAVSAGLQGDVLDVVRAAFSQ